MSQGGEENYFYENNVHEIWTIDRSGIGWHPKNGEVKFFIDQHGGRWAKFLPLRSNLQQVYNVDYIVRVIYDKS